MQVEEIKKKERKASPCKDIFSLNISVFHYQIIDGIPVSHNFMSLFAGSAAEFYWPGVIKVVANQYGVHLTDDDINNMHWTEKHQWLQRNPVTVARQIDFIFEQLWGKVILSGVHPVGQILNYDIRKEMQGRGTAHFHSAVHVKDAPKLDEATDEEFAAFADKYISCSIPDPVTHPKLHHLVLSRQWHYHKNTCKKNKTKDCRFHYPKPPCSKTIVARPPEGETAEADKEFAANVLEKVYTVLLKIDLNDPPTLPELLQEAGITEEQYDNVIKIAHRKAHVIYQRKPSEAYINPYNPVILEALEANMDIQIITNIWACIAYITSYITKPEKAMSELMRKAAKEAPEGNLSSHLYHVANAMRKGREVSQHEAIMRLLSIPLRKSNTEVLFVPTDTKENRTRILKPRKVLDSMDEDDKNIYVPSIHDKYGNRPDDMESICLAQFAANYTTASSTSDVNSENTECCGDDACDEINDDDDDVHDVETNNEFQQSSHTTRSKREPITLKNGMGKMYKRLKPQVIRYHYISKLKDEEAYYHRLLLLYHPWRNEEELTIKESYKTLFLELEQDLMATINTFEPYTSEVDNTIETFDPDELLPEVWEQIGANIAASTEQDQDHPDNNVPDDQSMFIDPDLLPMDPTPKPRKKPATFTLGSTVQRPDGEYYALVRSLNEEQRRHFDFVYNWCTDKKHGLNPDPFYHFVSGGGGVGKSHLIHTMYEGAIRVLRKPGHNVDCPTVLLCASTGKAASNINGTTLHSAFGLPVKEKGKKVEYKKPSAQRTNTMRAMFVNLEIIIADEISMFGGESLEHLNLALQHIFENDLPFGGKSLITVGDLLQLNPVGDRAVFKPPTQGYSALAGSLWVQHFCIHVLKEIVRQKGDPVFAEILSRIRIGKHTQEDIKILSTCKNTNTDHFPDDTINIFVSNEQVRDYNKLKMEQFQNKITIVAQDSAKDNDTNTTAIAVNLNQNTHATGGLPGTLTLAIGIKVLVTKNLDIADHLVNGVTGTVKKISVNPQSPVNGTIFIKFDSEEIGAKAKKTSPHKTLVPIQAITAKFPLSKHSSVRVERKMYPLLECFALTSHKAQGSTYSFMKAVFTLPDNMKSLQQGQAYTILSRATSRQGLLLEGFTPDAIKVNESALKEMDRMTQNASFTWNHPLANIGARVCIGFLNITSLAAHASDLKADKNIQNLTALCLSETHVTHMSEDYNLPAFKTLHLPSEHGLAMFIRTNTEYVQHSFPVNIQCMSCLLQLASGPLCMLSVYRPPHTNKTAFLAELSKILAHFKEERILLGGDFNLPPDDPGLLKIAKNYQLQQCTPDTPTHRQGSTLDLIFTSLEGISAGVFPLPYTDHYLTWIELPTL